MRFSVKKPRLITIKHVELVPGLNGVAPGHRRCRNRSCLGRSPCLGREYPWRRRSGTWWLARLDYWSKCCWLIGVSGQGARGKRERERTCVCEREDGGGYTLHKGARGHDQWSGRFLGIITGWDPSISKSNRSHVDILRFSFIKLRYIL